MIKPDIVIYSVGISNLTNCLRHTKLADALNSSGAVNCSSASERYGAKFVYLSSGYVMGGEDVVYREGDTPFPITVYGNTLSASEFYVQRSCLNYLVLRCAPLYGRSFNPKIPNWFEFLQTSLAKNQPMQVDGSVVTGHIDVFLLARILKGLLEAGVTNRLLHVSSKDWYSRFDFAELYADIFKKDKHLLQKASTTFPLDSQSAKKANSLNGFYNFKLDITNVEEVLGTKMPKVDESLHFTLKRFKNLAG